MLLNARYIQLIREMVRFEVGGSLGRWSTVRDIVGVIFGGTVVIKITVGVSVGVTGFFMLPEVLGVTGKVISVTEGEC